jgi:hypothetical protein
MPRKESEWETPVRIVMLNKVNRHTDQVGENVAQREDECLCIPCFGEHRDKKGPLVYLIII